MRCITIKLTLLLGKPAAGAIGAATATKSATTPHKAEENVNESEPVTGTRRTENSRSKSRKRASIFDKWVSKKEEAEDKLEGKREEKKIEREQKQEEKAELKEEKKEEKAEEKHGHDLTTATAGKFIHCS